MEFMHKNPLKYRKSNNNVDYRGSHTTPQCVCIKTTGRAHMQTPDKPDQSGKCLAVDLGLGFSSKVHHLSAMLSSHLSDQMI